MRSKFSALGGVLLLFAAAATAHAAPAATAVDIKRAAPKDANLAVYARENDEREYQRQYLNEAWETFKEERIGERVVDIITSRAPKEELDKVEKAWGEIKNALGPVNWDAVCGADEFVYAQKMQGPFQQYLVALRLSEADAEGFEKGVRQVFDLAEERSNSKVTVQTADVGETAVSTLRLPEKSPYHPCVARVGDIALFSTSPDMMTAAVEQLGDESAESKFDEPRIKAALEHLPEPEDVIVVFDGKQLFTSLAGIADFIRNEKPGDEGAERAARIVERLVNEVAIVDYEVGVEYTEEGQNRAASLGKLAEGYEDKLLYKALAVGKPFEDWQSWVPADATAYSLGTGLNLHVLYDGVLTIVREEIPESREALDLFEKKQQEIGVNIDEDILQSFSGEYVSVTVPIEVGGKESQQTVTALRCENPERIRELLGKAVDALGGLPAIAGQGVELKDAEGLDGFQEIHAMIFKTVGVQPVIGFHDGWMIVSSHRAAAEKLIAVRKGDAESLDSDESLAQFDLKVDGTTYAVSYQDVGAGVRQAADFIDKVGTMVPMFIGMAAAQAKPEDIKPVQEALGLLPSLAKVVRKFDYFEHKFSITREGPDADTYLRESVTEIRQAEGN